MIVTVKNFVLSFKNMLIFSMTTACSMTMNGLTVSMRS